MNKCGLSYSLKHDPRPFSEYTKVFTILSLTASKNALRRLPLIDWTLNWGYFHLSIKVSGGSTALVALFICDRLFVANTGDSRAVVYRSENQYMVNSSNCNLSFPSYSGQSSVNRLHPRSRKAKATRDSITQVCLLSTSNDIIFDHSGQIF